MLRNAQRFIVCQEAAHRHKMVQHALFEMVERLSNKLNDYPKQKEKLHLLVYSILGTDVEKVNQTRFDYQLAEESLQFYKSFDVPKIKNDDIPVEVSNVKFISNLANSTNIDIEIDDLIKPYFTE